MELPSDKQIGDMVSISFLGEEKIRGCIIKGVHFTEAKVYYDVDVPVVVKKLNQGFQLVKDIPSDHITK